jgi:hypothetical protein
MGNTCSPQNTLYAYVAPHHLERVACMVAIRSKNVFTLMTEQTRIQGPLAMVQEDTFAYDFSRHEVP